MLVYGVNNRKQFDQMIIPQYCQFNTEHQLSCGLNTLMVFHERICFGLSRMPTSPLIIFPVYIELDRFKSIVDEFVQLGNIHEIRSQRYADMAVHLDKPIGLPT